MSFSKDPDKRPSEKLLKKFSKLLFIAVLIFAVVFCCTLFSKGSVKNNSIVVKSAINNIGELATSEYSYTMVQTSEKPKKEVFGFAIPLTASKVIYSYDGLIKAGFDFTQIDVDLNKVTKTITCTLPETKILSSEVKYDSLNVYDENNNPFNAFTFEDMNLSIADLQQKAEQSAIDSGLLTNAYENAKTVIKSSISGLYDSDKYTLEFK